MKKIPSLFLRDWNTPPGQKNFVTRELNPLCKWVFDGEGKATIKWDGTCVKMGENFEAYARRSVKKGKLKPDYYVEDDFDPITEISYGWEPIHKSAYFKQWEEAVVEWNDTHTEPIHPGTYELCGPKINGNPEKLDKHILYKHGDLEVYYFPRDYDGIKKAFETFPNEGVVWHHPDGRMVKIKKKDFPQ